VSLVLSTAAAMTLVLVAALDGVADVLNLIPARFVQSIERKERDARRERLNAGRHK